MTEATRQKIVILHNQGYSLRDIGEKVGVSYQTVSRHLKKASEEGGGDANNEIPMSLEEIKVKQLHETGFGAHEIAEQLGMTRREVVGLLNRKQPRDESTWYDTHTPNLRVLGKGEKLPGTDRFLSGPPKPFRRPPKPLTLSRLLKKI